MKQFIFLVFILLIGFGFCFPEEKNVRSFETYVKYVNEAELCICNHELEKARSYYDTLFQWKFRVHARDYYNYGICCLKLKDTLSAIEKFAYLQERNYSEKYPFLLEYKKHYKKKQQSVADDSLYKLSEKIFALDQKANGNRFVDHRTYLTTIKSNISKSKEIMKKMMSDEHLHFSINTSKLYLPILHYYQMKLLIEEIRVNDKLLKKYPVYAYLKEEEIEDLEFEKMLKEAVFCAKLDRYTYADLVSMNGNATGNVIIHQFNNYKVVDQPFNLKDSVVSDFNQNRKELFLESFTDYYTKVKFHDLLFNKGELFPLKKSSKEDAMMFYDKMKSFEKNENFCIVGMYFVTFWFKEDQNAKNAFLEYREKYHR